MWGGERGGESMHSIHIFRNRHTTHILNDTLWLRARERERKTFGWQASSYICQSSVAANWIIWTLIPFETTQQHLATGGGSLCRKIHWYLVHSTSSMHHTRLVCACELSPHSKLCTLNYSNSVIEDEIHCCLHAVQHRTWSLLLSIISFNFFSPRRLERSAFAFTLPLYDLWSSQCCLLAVVLIMNVKARSASAVKLFSLLTKSQIKLEFRRLSTQFIL